MAPTTLRSVERPARLRISARASTPPAAANSWPTTLASLRRRPCSMSRMTSGLVSLIVAMRRATSACSSGLSSASTRAARVECTLATTRAIVDLAHDGGARLRAHAPQGGHLGRQRLDLALAEVLEDVGGALGAKADEQHGGLLASAQAGGAAIDGHGRAAGVALGALVVERGLLAHSG